MVQNGKISSGIYYHSGHTAFDFNARRETTDSIKGGITYEEAKVKADKLLEDVIHNSKDLSLDMSGIEMEDNPRAKIETAYFFDYVRKVDNMADAKYDHFSSMLSNPNYGGIFYDKGQERVSVAISKKGEVWLLKSVSPAQTVEKVTDNIEILPFERIQQSFSDYVSGADIDRPSELTNHKTFTNIHEIKLNMRRKDIEGKDGEYIFVPVWDFYFTEENISDYKGKDEYVNKLAGPRNLYVSINAIDGSIADFTKW